jgi:hypothetical protein
MMDGVSNKWAGSQIEENKLPRDCIIGFLECSKGKALSGK